MFWIGKAKSQAQCNASVSSLREGSCVGVLVLVHVLLFLNTSPTIIWNTQQMQKSYYRRLKSRQTLSMQFPKYFSFHRCLKESYLPLKNISLLWDATVCDKPALR